MVSKIARKLQFDKKGSITNVPMGSTRNINSRSFRRFFVMAGLGRFEVVKLLLTS